MIISLLIIALHIYTFVDAFGNINSTRNGVFRMVLVFIPVVGPLIYFLLKTSETMPEQYRRRSRFMDGKNFPH